MLNSNLKKKRRIAIFIRDVPSFGHAPIALSLLSSLAEQDVYPVYFYSVAELIKDKRNLRKMVSLANSPNPKSGASARSPLAIAKGCDALIRHLFERAMRSVPELIVVDYMSESLVDVRRLTKITKKLNYKVIFLKKALCNDYESRNLEETVNFVSTRLKHQNHADIWCQREADKWWHEIDKIFLHSDFNRKALPPYQYSPYLFRMPPSSLGEFMGPEAEKMSPAKLDCIKYIREQVEKYRKHLESLASLISGDFEAVSDPDLNNDNNPSYMPNSSIPESSKDGDTADTSSSAQGEPTGTTLIVIDDFHYRRPGRARLFDLIVEKLIEVKMYFHAVPIGDLIVLPRFQLLFEWFRTRSDMDLMDTYSYLFLDTFNTLYKNEHIVILDNIHEGIVMSSYYISKAIESGWEVLVLKRDKFWPPNDDEIVEKTIQLLKGKYESKPEEQGHFSSHPLSIRNNAFGDYLSLS